MSIAELSEIHQILAGRSQTIAQAWRNALLTQSPISLEEAQLNAHFEDFTEQLITLLTAESFSTSDSSFISDVQALGGVLESVDNLQPEDVVEIQTTLAQELVKGLTPEQCAILLPRIVSVLTALEAAFFVSKAHNAKRFDMDAMSKMGHDLKTPINAITGFSRVILKGIDGPITEFQQQDLTSVYEAGKKLLDMINDMFEVAKNDAGKTDLYEASFDVADLLGDILKTAQPILARREHGIEVGGRGNLGAMQGNASQVRWILMGVLFHGARVSPEGSLSLSASRERAQHADWLLFEITKLLAGQSGTLEEFPMQSITEAADSDMDVAMITALNFCKELGGTVAMAQEAQGLVRFTVRLPARMSVADFTE